MINTEKIDDFVLQNANDYPDFSNAYIESATWDTGHPLTEEELDELNDNREFVYQACLDWYF